MGKSLKYYHIFNKSIEKYTIFRESSDYVRMVNLFQYYRYSGHPFSFSDSIRRKQIHGCPLIHEIHIIAYCIMPTHIHLIVCECKEKGISIFASHVLNSYTRFFNIKYDRKGPLWVRRTKRVEILHTDHLLHASRYIHRNPVRAHLTPSPSQWAYSSIHEYCGTPSISFCSFHDIITCTQQEYRHFVETPYENE